MRDSNPRPPQCQCDALPTALTAHYLKNPFGRCVPPLEKTFTGCFFFGRVLTAHYLKNPFGRCATTSRKNIHRMFFLRQSANRPLFKNPFGRWATTSRKNIHRMFFLRQSANRPLFCYRGDMPNFLSDNKKDASCVLYLRNSSGGTRTYNPSVNSRMLCH